MLVFTLWELRLHTPTDALTKNARICPSPLLPPLADYYGDAMQRHGRRRLVPQGFDHDCVC